MFNLTSLLSALKKPPEPPNFTHHLHCRWPGCYLQLGQVSALAGTHGRWPGAVVGGPLGVAGGPRGLLGPHGSPVLHGGCCGLTDLPARLLQHRPWFRMCRHDRSNKNPQSRVEVRLIFGENCSVFGEKHSVVTLTKANSKLIHWLLSTIPAVWICVMERCCKLREVQEDNNKANNCMK